MALNFETVTLYSEAKRGDGDRHLIGKLEFEIRATRHNKLHLAFSLRQNRVRLVKISLALTNPTFLV